MSLPDLSDLSHYHQRIDLIKATALQIQKDLQLSDEKLSFSGKIETAYQELFQQLLPVIDRFLNLETERFFNLLYKVDLDEGKVRALLFGANHTEPAAEITKLVIQRELLKVIIRKHFSSSL
jgi:hypothetical protein